MHTVSIGVLEIIKKKQTQTFGAERPLDPELSDRFWLTLDRVLLGAHLTERSESQPASHCSYPLW